MTYDKCKCEWTMLGKWNKLLLVAFQMILHEKLIRFISYNCIKKIKKYLVVIRILIDLNE